MLYLIIDELCPLIEQDGESISCSKSIFPLDSPGAWSLASYTASCQRSGLAIVLLQVLGIIHSSRPFCRHNRAKTQRKTFVKLYVQIILKEYLRAEKDSELTHYTQGNDLTTVQRYNAAATRYDTVIVRYPYMENEEMTECSWLERRFYFAMKEHMYY